MQLMEAQKIEDKALLASNKEELSSAAREISRLKELVETMQITVAQKDKDIATYRDAAVQMEVEREVRLRAERREEMEREERIAACAQLLATQSDCASRIREAEEKANSTIVSLHEQLHDLERQRETDASKFEEISEKAAVLEGQLCQYQSALENAKANHETVAELGQVKGELELLRRRLSEQNEFKQHESAAAQQKIIELENRIAENDAQRRKLHNLIQELRGNVRVFARVRPFLPSDEIEGTPESTVITRHDNAGIRIVRQPQKPDEKLEEHAFTFDKSFAQSTSQVTW
jgi:kinesin family member C1